MRHSEVLLVVLLGVSFAALVRGASQETITSPATQKSAVGATIKPASSYVLGPDDVIAIRALNAEEINSGSVRIDLDGYISLPLLGRLAAGGLTVERLESELSAHLRTYVREPVVAVSVVEYRSQPVSVIGSVGRAGVHQLEGRKTLVEILAQAGGLLPEASNVIKITRKAEWGLIPLPSAVRDPTGQFSVAEVTLKGIVQATKPEDNILIMPHDVISVPRADLVYVLGEVRRPGGFVLHERATISGLQALAMAEGFTGSAAPHKALIIRPSPDGKRIEIAANLREILNGKRSDVTLQPDDILLIPTNVAKSALVRTIQTAVQAAASAAIYVGIY